LIDNTNAVNLAIICGVIEEIEHAYGRKGKNTYSGYQFIEENKIEVIEKKLLEKIKTLSEEHNFFDYKEVEYVYRMWRFLEKESFDLYMDSILSQPKNVPKYLNICVGTWNGGKKRGWTFERETFSEYIDKNDAYEKICALKNTEEFSSLSHSIKEVAIAFYLWFNNKDNDYHDINIENVNAIIPEWEKGK